jgi:hypothetical protein
MADRLAVGQSEHDPPSLGQQFRPAPRRPKMINDLRILQIAPREVGKTSKASKSAARGKLGRHAVVSLMKYI